MPGTPRTSPRLVPKDPLTIAEIDSDLREACRMLNQWEAAADGGGDGARDMRATIDYLLQLRFSAALDLKLGQIAA